MMSRARSRWGIGLAGLALMMATMTARADEPAAALPLISLEPSETGLTIVGRALALEDARFAGEMVIERQGSGGKVSTRQGGDLDLAAGETGDIARVGISYAAGDRLRVTVILSHEGTTIAETSLSTGQ